MSKISGERPILPPSQFKARGQLNFRSPVHVLNLDRESTRFKKNLFSGLKEKIVQDKGAVLCPIHLGYGRNLLSLQLQTLKADYKEYENRMIKFLTPNTLSLFCFVSQNQIKQFKLWVNETGIKSPVILIPTLRPDNPMPILPPSRDLSFMDGWYKLSRIFEALGVKNICYLGEMHGQNDDNKYDGCVAEAQRHLPSFRSEILLELTFPAGVRPGSSF